MKSIATTTLSDYLLSDNENESLAQLQTDLFNFCLQRQAIASNSSEQVFMSIQNYFTVIREAIHTEKSEVAYLEVLDAVSDCKDTQLDLLHDLYLRFINVNIR